MASLSDKACEVYSTNKCGVARMLGITLNTLLAYEEKGEVSEQVMTSIERLEKELFEAQIRDVVEYADKFIGIKDDKIQHLLDNGRVELPLYPEEGDSAEDEKNISLGNLIASSLLLKEDLRRAVDLAAASLGEKT